jgi:hypothetical protein
MNDPVPGAEDTQPTLWQRLPSKIPQIPETDQKQAGQIAQKGGKLILTGAVITVGAIAFLTKPVATLLVGGTLYVGGKALEKSNEIQEAVAEVETAAAS